MSTSGFIAKELAKITITSSADSGHSVDSSTAAVVPPQPSKKKILIVEDNTVNRNLFVQILKKEYSCEEAIDGQDAVTQVKNASTPFDLILMDMQMPVMGGQEATNEIRKIDIKVPIICLSTDINNEKDFKELTGMNDFVHKSPVNRSALKLKIKEYTEGKKSTDFPIFSANIEAKKNVIAVAPVSGSINSGILIFKPATPTPTSTSSVSLPNPSIIIDRDLAANSQGEISRSVVSPRQQLVVVGF